jgi:hypothetical protein
MKIDVALGPMDSIQRSILTGLYKKKTEPNRLSFNPVGQDAANISVGEFEEAWRALKEAGFVTGGIFRHFIDGEVKELGTITPAGEEELKRENSSRPSSVHEE